jgi:hypothetical protein
MPVKAPSRDSARLAPLAVAVLSCAACFPRFALAQANVYGLNFEGKLSINGTVIDSLSSDFDDEPIVVFWEAWQALSVEGSNRYAMRRDGRVSKNGVKIFQLPWSNAVFEWVSMSVENDNIYCLRQDGLLSANDDSIIDYSRDDFFFRRIIARNGSTYSLRSDGNVFKNTQTEPILRFRGGTGNRDFEDGEDFDTVWVTLSFPPAAPILYALRSDGKVYRSTVSVDSLDGEDDGEPDEGEVEQVAELPFTGSDFLEIEDFYVDLEFTGDGIWKALKADGNVYASDSQVASIVDYPGHADDDDTIYTGLAVHGDSFYAIRSDGQVFLDTDTEPLLFLPSDNYNGSLAISSDPPDLSNFDNAKPVAAVYNVKANSGTPLSIPVVVTDTDKVEAEIAVAPVDPLPAGVVWDGVNRSFVWDNPGPAGSYKLLFEVNDGVNSPVQFKHSVKLLEPDDNLEKNKKPYLSKIKKAQAVVGQPLSLTVIADDADGDALSVSVDPLAPPFINGASFNPATRVFTWTPAFEDQGKMTVEFFISDGTVSKTLKVKITVKNSFIF